MATCIACGCSDDHACVGGCSWAKTDPPVCDRCDGSSPFVVHHDRRGWQVVGPGPFAAESVTVILVDDGLEARRLVDVVNAVHAGGVKAGSAITAEVAARRMTRLEERQRPPRGGRARSS